MMTLKDFWKTASKDYVHGWLDASRTTALQLGPIQENATYVTVKLRKMKIVDSRVAFSKYYAAVQSELGLIYANGPKVTFRQLIAPPALNEVSGSTKDRTIVVDQAILGPTPYRGGTLDVSLSLLSVKSADLAGPMLRVLSSLASAAGVSYVKMAEPFLGPLQEGIELLTGTKDAANREVALVAGLQPKAGVYVVARATKDQLDLGRAGLDGSLLLTDEAGQPVTSFPYMIVSIEGATERPDFMGIPEVRAAYDAVKKTVEDDDAAGYKDAIAVFRRATLLSDDLIQAHAQKLYNDVKTKMDSILGSTKTGADGGTRNVPDLGSFNPFE